jgi:ubiquinone/menaquinone biosynthesis C-methylase UbiE
VNSIDEEYNLYNIILGSKPFDFMNHGFSPASRIILDEDLLFSNQITMYLNMFNDIDIKNKKILEVGCGRGGGISSIAKYLNTKDLYACDQNKMNIEYCKNNQKDFINFKQSDAHFLDYDDNFFDIVLNVESSHCYDNPELFFNEVTRVLKNDGIFLYVDCGKVIHQFYKYFYLFDKIIEEDITKNVMNSCREDSIKFNNMIDDEQIRDIYVNIANIKFNEYSKSDSQYIKYVAYKDAGK